jgi:UDP-N-acetyl-2-amino-2-deoxyglucuronate dehydrogenase
MSSITFGLLGCGRVAGRWTEVMASEIKNADVIGVCDIVKSKAENVAGLLNGDVKVCDDLQELIELKPDVIAILTESGNHYSHAKIILESGIHVIVEKPIALIPEHAYELELLSEKQKLMYTEVKQNRFNPAIAKLKEVYDSDRFGKIVTATIRLRWCRYQDYYEDGWHGTWAMDGGVINQQAIHHVDALSWICGPVAHVCAHGENRMNALEAEDTMIGLVRLANGGVGTIEATTAARPEDFEASLSIVGEKGIVVVGGIALNKIEMWSFVEPEDDDKNIPNSFSQEVPTGYGLGHGPYIQEVVDRLLNGNTTPVVSATDGGKAEEIVHALYVSIETGTWVSLDANLRSSKLGLQ